MAHPVAHILQNSPQVLEDIIPKIKVFLLELKISDSFGCVSSAPCGAKENGLSQQQRVH